MSIRPAMSIVTPSFNMLPFLKRCHNSIADQSNVSVEHIVVDGGSTDGTTDWLNKATSIVKVIEKDESMYDAVNKGLRLAKGEIVAYLNCDEQYLPGTLQRASEFLAMNPHVDGVFGNFLVVRSNGDLIAYRKAGPARWQYIATSYLYVFSCTLFFRRKIIEDGFMFDTSYKAIGDMDFVLRLLRSGYRFEYLNQFLSAFTFTGGNLGVSGNAVREWKRFLSSQPMWLRAAKYPLNAARLVEKALHGAYTIENPLEYSIYTDDNESKRKEVRIVDPTFRWNPLNEGIEAK